MLTSNEYYDPGPGETLRSRTGDFEGREGFENFPAKLFLYLLLK